MNEQEVRAAARAFGMRKEVRDKIRAALKRKLNVKTEEKLQVENLKQMYRDSKRERALDMLALKRKLL